MSAQAQDTEQHHRFQILISTIHDWFNGTSPWRFDIRTAVTQTQRNILAGEVAEFSKVCPDCRMPETNVDQIFHEIRAGEWDDVFLEKFACGELDPMTLYPIVGRAAAIKAAMKAALELRRDSRQDSELGGGVAYPTGLLRHY